MGASDVRGAILAMMATIIYYLGFIVFRVAAGRMPVLRGTRPFRLIRSHLLQPALAHRPGHRAGRGRSPR